MPKKTPKFVHFCLLSEYLNANVEKHLSETYMIFSLHIYVVLMTAASQPFCYRNDIYPKYLISPDVFSEDFWVISAGALHWTSPAWGLQGVFIWDFLPASSSLSWVPPATQGGSPSSLSCLSSAVKSLHWSNSSSRSYSFFMESYPWVKWWTTGQVSISTHGSYYIAPRPKYFG